MKPEEIQERNKQIAFMLGAVEVPEDKWYKIGGYKKHVYFPNRSIPNRFLLKGVKFHSDWNWLMQAVEFINKVHSDKGIIPLCLTSLPIYTEKESVFITISDFAEFYNQGGFNV